MNDERIRGARAPLTVAASALFAVALTGSAFAWGAIAVDDEAGTHPDDVGYGYSSGHNSAAAARSGAMAECRKQGNTGCKVVLTFEHCGAYAASHRHYGIAEGSTAAAARREAVAACGPGCQAVVANCD